MKKAVALAAVLVMVAAATTTIAQSKPTNFAGKWTLVVDPNAPAPTGRGGRGGFGGLGQAFAATQDDKILTVVSTTQMGETKSVYNLDGSDSKNTMTFGENSIERVSKAKWDGAKLVITTTSNFQGNPFVTTQTWSLDPAGALVVESTSNVGGTAATTKTTYKKG